jgi:hypothetical protein
MIMETFKDVVEKYNESQLMPENRVYHTALPDGLMRVTQNRDSEEEIFTLASHVRVTLERLKGENKLMLVGLRIQRLGYSWRMDITYKKG